MNQIDRELLRQAVTGYLATRQGLEFEAGAIRRSIIKRGAVDFEVADQDVEQALAFGEGNGWVGRRRSEVGVTEYWSATSEGVLAAERKEWLV
jgi:hypothetical protein